MDTSWQRGQRKGFQAEGAAFAEEGDTGEGDAFWEQLLVIPVTAVIGRTEGLPSVGAWMSFITRPTGKETWALQCERTKLLC